MTTNKETFPKPFRSFLSYTIFLKKYAHQGCETWEDLCRVLVEEVVEKRMTQDDKDRLIKYMQEMKFIPGGRYLYYANRPVRFYNNCLEKNTKVLTTQGWRKVPLSWCSAASRDCVYKSAWKI